MDRLFNFVGGGSGAWKVLSTRAVTGETLFPVERLAVIQGEGIPLQGSLPPEGRLAGQGQWVLRGVVSNERYVTHGEREDLRAVQPPLGREQAVMAALIPIRKSEAWWALAQDERRAVMEDQSRHIRLGMKYLPAVARKLHHCRDLGEPFDFLTWFEYAPDDAPAFEELVGLLRGTPEWKYVDREVDIRLIRA